MERRCPECSQIVYGRADKKFCSDMCRNAFNNKQNAETTNLIRNINYKLRKNYHILQEICPGEKTKATKKSLLEKGFEFYTITSTRTTKKGSIYYFVYDLGYLELGEDWLLVVRDYGRPKD